ncbi:hypothetical protein [Aquiflexum gelatinilyticum]|uniref:hypothetical protein n=1 Tax=Aquiflexum gelatinilyticum TaxID=2961943 RepID=UPI002169BA2D|nr:hypothetical protein [Aquiflexum gelatinilyticum]MCS4434275.1 hypothetical protein [Aquiflexum gelatinilyticum]
MKKDLNRKTRGINHYLHFKSDFENESDRLFNSLPLFYRIMYLDQPNPWVNQINRFDFIRLATISAEFEKYQLIQIAEFEYKKINPNSKKDICEIKLDDFFSSNILKSKGKEFTVKEFIMTLGYNGGIHMIPDKNEEKVKILYEELFLIQPDFCFDLTKSISKVLLDIYDELYSLSVGDNNGHSPNVNYQAIIVDQGKILDGILFDKAYMQFPIRAKKNKGIHFCIEIMVKNNSNRNLIMSYGHRKNDELNISIWQQKTKIISKVSTKNSNKTIISDIEDKIGEYFLFEVACYPNGKIVCAINENLKSVEDLKDDIHIIDGKVILGSNLDGNEFGNFQEKCLVIQSIDKNNYTMNLGVYAMRRLNIIPQHIPYNLIKRTL